MEYAPARAVAPNVTIRMVPVDMKVRWRDS